MRVLLWGLGLVSCANAVWMLASPEAWYHDVPAAVPDTGPLNVHFVRDIGAAFITFGIGLIVAAERSRFRQAAVSGAAIFFGLHAAIHVADILSGRLEASHWLIDAPGVFVPAIVLLVLADPRRWREAAA